MKQFQIYFFRFSFVAVLLFAFLEGSAQCAMCKAIAESGGDAVGKQVGTGINEGILYLMIIPYIILFLLFRKKIVHLFREIKALYK
jgi:hypothetical protein